MESYNGAYCGSFSNILIGLPAKETLEQLEQIVSPSDFEKATYAKHPRLRRFEKIVRFNSIPLVKAGWLTKSRGRWYVTEEGKRAYEQYRDPEVFSREGLRLYRTWSASQPQEAELEEGADEASGPVTSASTAAVTLEEAEEGARAEIEGVC